MSKVTLSLETYRAMMEQLSYWADYCDDSEGYLASIIEDAKDEASQSVSKDSLGN